MRDRGLNVTAIEIDSDAAAEAELSATVMHVLDLEAPGALAPLAGQDFDLILAADVFEHLRDPAACLAQVVPLLREGGRLIVSIPNIAHADLRLALLEGRFEYTDIGLLDHTHLSFFTRERLAGFLADGGLTTIAWHRIHRDIGATETSLRPDLVEWGKLVLADDPEATTYQWIVECTRNTETTPPATVEAEQPAVDPLEQRIRAAAATWEPPVAVEPPSSHSRWGEFIARVRGRIR
jgi:SAM-dependent methyltransferase